MIDSSDSLTYATHNKGNSVIAEKFMRTLKAKIYKKRRPNDIKLYLSFLNKLVDQCNNTYHYYIGKKAVNAI